jgi:hypothetical protein
MPVPEMKCCGGAGPPISTPRSAATCVCAAVEVLSEPTAQPPSVLARSGYPCVDVHMPGARNGIGNRHQRLEAR